jgi:hypothetical protein
VSLNPQPQTETEAWRAILDYPHARTAFDKLCEAGCNSEDLKCRLLLVGNDLKREKNPVRTDLRKFRALPRRLRALADDLITATPLERVDITVFDNLVNKILDLGASMGAMADLLDGMAPFPRARATQYPLVIALLNEVRKRTRAYHYAHVSELLNAISLQLDMSKDFSPEALRNLVHRQKKKRVASAVYTPNGPA